MGTWRLIDGYNMAFRAFYAMGDLKRADDAFPTGALHGWVRTFWKLEDDRGRADTAVFFDCGGSVRHRTLLPEYKAQRASMPDAMRMQMPLIKGLTRLMGYRLIEREGVEADDLIGASAVFLKAKGVPVEIVSSDKDFGQLVGDGILQITPPPTANPKLGWKTLDADGVQLKFGVSPSQIVDYLSMIGDVSDNIKGIEGVGPKTAAKWLSEYGDIDALLKKWNWVSPERFRVVLNRSRELLERNRALVALKCDWPVAEDLAQNAVADTAGLTAFFETYDMKASAREVGRRYV